MCTKKPLRVPQKQPKACKPKRDSNGDLAAVEALMQLRAERGAASECPEPIASGGAGENTGAEAAKIEVVEISSDEEDVVMIEPEVKPVESDAEVEGFPCYWRHLLALVNVSYYFLTTPDVGPKMHALGKRVLAFIKVNNKELAAGSFPHTKDEDSFIDLVFRVAFRNGTSALQYGFIPTLVLLNARMVGNNNRKPVVDKSIHAGYLIRILPCKSSAADQAAPNTVIKQSLNCVTLLGGWPEFVKYMIASEANRNRIRWWLSEYTLAQFGSLDEFYVILEIMARRGTAVMSLACFQAFRLSASRQVELRIGFGHPDPLPLRVMLQFAKCMNDAHLSMELRSACADYIILKMKYENSPDARLHLLAVINLVGSQETARRVLRTLFEAPTHGWIRTVALCIPLRSQVHFLIAKEPVANRELLMVFQICVDEIDESGWPQIECPLIERQ